MKVGDASRERAGGEIDWSAVLRLCPAKEIKQRACLVFPFLWTLDLLSQRFNFWPLLRTRFFSRGSPVSPSVSVPPTSSGVLPNVFNARTRDNASFSLRDKAMHNATAIRSRAPVSGICLCPSIESIESLLSFYLSCLALFFPFSFFFSPLFLRFLSPFPIQSLWNTLLNGTDRVGKGRGG